MCDIRHRVRARGFTLIEVMMALFIFALVSVMFGTALWLSKTACGMNGQYAQAISLCQHKMDKMRAMGYGRLVYAELVDAEIIDTSPSTSPYTFLSTPDNVRNCLPNVTAATIRIEQAANSYDSTRVRKVTVTITWKSNPKRAAASTVSAVGYIANAD